MTSPKIKISLAAAVLAAMSPFVFLSVALCGLVNAAAASQTAHSGLLLTMWMVSPYAAYIPFILLHRLDDAGLVEVVE